jgi:CubicO group peptidase (beta-lactamase class C family)
MTMKQALKEGRKRWGKNAALSQRPGWCAVGTLVLGMMVVRATGSTWEEAFKAADNRKPDLSKMIENSRRLGR